MSQGHGGFGPEPYPWFWSLHFLLWLSASACHYIKPHFLGPQIDGLGTRSLAVVKKTGPLMNGTKNVLTLMEGESRVLPIFSRITSCGNPKQCCARKNRGQSCQIHVSL